MIVIGNKKIRILNPAQIVHLELSEGKKSVYAKGDTDADGVHVKSISVREPWSVVIRTPVDTHYLNFKNFNEALDHAVELCKQINPTLNVDLFKEQLRRLYEPDKEKKKS